MIIRATFIVSGRVQGATYRDKVEELVFRNFRKQITGEIKNLNDGTVRIICEGEKTVVKRFRKAIRIDRWPIVVMEVKAEYSRPQGRFKGFKVLGRKATHEDILQRLDLGMSYMGEMKGGIDRTNGGIDRTIGGIDRTNSSIDLMNHGIDRTISGLDRTNISIRAMNRNMGSHFKKLGTDTAGHFDKLDAKYGEFGETMKGMAADIKEIRKAITNGDNESATG